jgi:tetratricopeptide (TPR) repeat protein
MTSIPLTKDGLVSKIIITPGTGPQPKEGDRVAVSYEGKLRSNGVRFDSSKNSEKPFEFTIGQRVITGWSIGVATMQVGELSVFTIAPEYGYGNQGKPPSVPPDATLVFEIELLEILIGPSKQQQAIAKAMDECEQGIVAFREGRLSDAINLFSQGRLTLMFEGKDESDPSYFPQDYADIKLRLNRNLAVAHAKNNDFNQSLTYAKQVLDFLPNDAKGLAKKLEAEIRLGLLGDARKTLDKALGVTHNDPALVPLKKELEELEKADRIRMNETFKMMTKKTEGSNDK